MVTCVASSDPSALVDHDLYVLWSPHDVVVEEKARRRGPPYPSQWNWLLYFQRKSDDNDHSKTPWRPARPERIARVAYAASWSYAMNEINE